MRNEEAKSVGPTRAPDGTRCCRGQYSPPLFCPWHACTVSEPNRLPASKPRSSMSTSQFFYFLSFLLIFVMLGKTASISTTVFLRASHFTHPCKPCKSCAWLCAAGGMAESSTYATLSDTERGGAGKSGSLIDSERSRRAGANNLTCFDFHGTLYMTALRGECEGVFTTLQTLMTKCGLEMLDCHDNSFRGSQCGS